MHNESHRQWRLRVDKTKVAFLSVLFSINKKKALYLLIKEPKNRTRKVTANANGVVAF